MPRVILETVGDKDRSVRHVSVEQLLAVEVGIRLYQGSIKLY